MIYYRPYYIIFDKDDIVRIIKTKTLCTQIHLNFKVAKYITKHLYTCIIIYLQLGILEHVSKTVVGLIVGSDIFLSIYKHASIMEQN